MSDPTPKPASVFDDPEVKESIQRFFVANKGQVPYKHGYFNAKYGQRAKEIIDFIVETKKPFKIPLEEGYTIHALRQQWYEGTRFLRKHLDPTLKYTQYLAFIKCHVEYDYIEIRPRPALRGALLASGDTTKQAEWKEEFLTWIDSDPPEMDKFERTDVVLANSDIEWGQNQLNGVEKLFYATFERNKVLVVRYTHE